MAGNKEICCLLERSTKIKAATKIIISILLQAFEYPYIPAKLKVVEYVAGKLNKNLRGFQTDQPMVPFLNGTLLELVYSLMSMFINNDTMKKAILFKIIENQYQ